MTRRGSRVVVKLGGSVITDKRGGRPRIRRQVLARLAAELAEAPRGHLVGVVHGAGSFGHGPVHRAGLHRGARTRAQRLAWGEIQVLQNELNAVVCRALLAAGLPAVPCQASAAAVLEGRRLVHLDDTALRELHAQSMIPVLYGVPAADRAQGCAILSGDVLAPELALRLGADLLLLGTDVDGVYAADPRRDPTAERFDRITPATWPRVADALGGAAGHDVTGGMRGKVTALLGYARRGLAARIVDVRRPGRLADALRGAELGTLVTPDP
jgi:isopentenyl phosphate kinase